MKKPMLGRIISAATMFYVAMFFTTGLQAALIKTGQFSLVQDKAKFGIEQGELVASITFTAEETSTTNMEGLSIFNVIRLEVIDRTADLNLDRNKIGSPDGISLIGDFLYDATPTATNAGTSSISQTFYAYYSPTGAFIGIEGAIMESDPLTRGIIFSVIGTTLSSSAATSWNVNSLFGDSFAQVPEPSALALLSIGLVGFGVARRRGSRG